MRHKGRSVELSVDFEQQRREVFMPLYIIAGMSRQGGENDSGRPRVIHAQYDMDSTIDIDVGTLNVSPFGSVSVRDGNLANRILLMFNAARSAGRRRLTAEIRSTQMGLLLPAVQKVREAAGRHGGANVSLLGYGDRDPLAFHMPAAKLMDPVLGVDVHMIPENNAAAGASVIRLEIDPENSVCGLVPKPGLRR